MPHPPVRRAAIAALVAVAMSGASLPALAGSTFDDIKPGLFGAARIEDGRGIVTFKAPFRAEDDRRVPVSATASFADGRTVKSLAFVIDENPMPLVARISFDKPDHKVTVGVDIRVNGPSPVRAVVEASDGRWYMAESMVRTSGLGACAAPPVGDPKLALTTMGQMSLVDTTPKSDTGTVFERRARLDLKHPNHTGMQMDQITLHFIPARYVSSIEVRQGGERLFTAETGFAMAENPRIEFDYKLGTSDHIDVLVKDTEGTSFEKSFPVGAGG